MLSFPPEIDVLPAALPGMEYSPGQLTRMPDFLQLGHATTAPETSVVS